MSRAASTAYLLVAVLGLAAAFYSVTNRQNYIWLPMFIGGITLMFGAMYANYSNPVDLRDAALMGCFAFAFAALPASVYCKLHDWRPGLAWDITCLLAPAFLGAMAMPFVRWAWERLPARTVRNAR